MQVGIKIICLLVAVSASEHLSSNEYVRKRLSIAVSILFVLGVWFFNSEYYFAILIGYLLMLKVYSFFAVKLIMHQEVKEVNKVVQDLNFYKHLAITKELRCQELSKALESSTKDIEQYCNTLQTFTYCFSELYDKGEKSDEVRKMQADLESKLKNPVVLTTERHISLFNNLVTVRDFKRARKILEQLRSSYYFGDGFDYELNGYIKLLKEGELIASNRVHKK